MWASPQTWLIGLLLVATLLWLQQLRSRNAGWVDVFWVAGTGLCGLAYLLGGSGQIAPRLLAGALLAVWSGRLASHLFRRIAADSQEDGRYRAMREALGQHAPLVFLFFYWGQALLAWGFALAFWVIAQQQQWTPWLFLGVAIGVAGIAGETLADRQLAGFRQQPANRGRTCRNGLWGYSRHPNYFCEWLHWLGYPLIAVGAEFGSWLWLLPAMMLLFLWFVTGIPYTERQALKSRADYPDYQRRTSAFFPWRAKP